MKHLGHFEIIPKYEGDFVTIVFTEKLAKQLAILNREDGECFDRFCKAVENLEIALLDSGYINPPARMFLVEDDSPTP